MRVTDDRYTGELDKFDLAVRMIGHEARTGTIRSCTGFTEDRIRKLYGTYFTGSAGPDVRRRRGKSPRQIARFVNCARRQTDATLLACLFRYCSVFHLSRDRRPEPIPDVDRVLLGARICQAFETYQRLVPDPQFSFEWSWNLYHALIETRELYFAWCESCRGPYIQDSYALDYRRCPLCEFKDQAMRD
ncbi:MAG: hypothetical protein ACE5G3_00850 [Gammaproteobacteria bacterium]